MSSYSVVTLYLARWKSVQDVHPSQEAQEQQLRSLPSAEPKAMSRLGFANSTGAIQTGCGKTNPAHRSIRLIPWLVAQGEKLESRAKCAEESPRGRHCCRASAPQLAAAPLALPSEDSSDQKGLLITSLEYKSLVAEFGIDLRGEIRVNFLYKYTYIHVYINIYIISTAHLA